MISIHRLLTEPDKENSVVGWKGVIFQSTGSSRSPTFRSVNHLYILPFQSTGSSRSPTTAPPSWGWWHRFQSTGSSRSPTDTMSYYPHNIVDFNPQAPRGARLKLRVLYFIHGGISIHRLLAEPDTIFHRSLSFQFVFQSTGSSRSPTQLRLIFGKYLLFQSTGSSRSPTQSA